MFKHKLLATEGLFPGINSTRSIANLGAYDIEVIIQPVRPSSGGGWAPTPLGQKSDFYKVTVRVIVNGKVYETSHIVSDMDARVIAKLHGIKIFSGVEPVVSVNGIQVDYGEYIVTAGSVTLNTGKD